jgi:Domain of unknown function (DUF4937
VLAKWIVCRVSGSNRPAFSAAQQKWSRIAGCNGFIGQFGGFCGKHAHVIGLCSKRDLYEQFMQRDHGAIAPANWQQEFYANIRVCVLSKVMDMPGEHASLANAVPSGVFARVAVCEVHKPNVEHFLAMQREVWTPAMAGAPGMLGGAFWSFEGQPNRFLVSSLWRSESEHSTYMSEAVPTLRQCAAAEQDLVSVQGYHFDLQRTWSVCPSRHAPDRQGVVGS